ncbi:MAG: isoprenyl transferase [Balneolaceae bacterium]|nr:MAG: isoprenyl transferase [Balneolaceae bacterium]
MVSDPLTNARANQSEDDIELQNQLKASGKLPSHIAIIMDGNGRWAQKKGNIRLHGHKAGVKSVRDITESCAQIGVNYLTLYAFSTENWNRPASEINGLMKLLVQSLRDETETLQKNDIKLITIGQIDRLPAKCRSQLQEVMDLTKNNKRMQLCLALSYSGRWDITEAVRSITREVQKGNIEPDDVNDDLIGSFLSTANIPDPDLIIRTSGEYRISNFLLWQLAYSELYITQTYWPDFRRDELYEAIRSYQTRERRYGKVKNGYNKSIATTVINHITS